MKKEMNNSLPRIDVVFDYKHEGSDKENKTGTVWVRVYEARTRRKYISTGVRVLPREWSDKWMVVCRTDSAALNALIREQVDKCKASIQNAMESEKEMPTTQMMKVDRSKASFVDFMEREIEKAKIEQDTRKHHRMTLSLLYEWGKMMKFEQVNRNNILAFVEWVSSRTTKKRISGRWVEMPLMQTTIFDHYKRVRKYVQLAIEAGKVQSNALVGVHVAKGENREREHLSDEEIDRWENTPMPLPYLEDARDRFIVQMGTGLSYKDLMLIDWTKHERIGEQTVLTGRRMKTGAPYFIVMLPMAVQVMERWGWQMPQISNTNYNVFLDRVSILCGINKHITSHVARHTYACHCLSHGVRIEAVQRTLGHKKLQTTEVYAKLVDQDVLAEFRKAGLTQ